MSKRKQAPIQFTISSKHLDVSKLIQNAQNKIQDTFVDNQMMSAKLKELQRQMRVLEGEKAVLMEEQVKIVQQSCFIATICENKQTVWAAMSKKLNDEIIALKKSVKEREKLL